MTRGDSLDGPTSNLAADSIDIQLSASQLVAPTKLPYWLYLVAQWFMLSLTTVMIPTIWGSLLFSVFAIQQAVGSWWIVIPIWPAFAVASLLFYCALLVLLKWILVGRLRPGVYPIHGWMYARWVTLRALHEQAGNVFMPVIRRTALMPILLRALGAKVESITDTVIDSLAIYDFDLISMGAGTCIYAGASITGAFVAPAGYLGRAPVLVLSPVKIGRGCHLGHRCVITAGTNVPDFHNLKPHAAPGHPGDAPVAGPLADHPHFTPEERLSTFSSLCGGILVVIWESVMQIPAIALSLYIIYLAIGFASPLTSDHTLGQGIAYWALFIVLYRFISRPIAMLMHVIMVWAWKWCAVGRLTPGRDVTASWRSLMAFAVLRRLVECQPWQWIQDYLAPTPLMGALYRALGARVGRDIFLGGLTVVEFDALTLGDRACTGSSSRVYATTDDGLVESVVLADDATLGNGSTLYPGCRVGEHAVVGNDTPICADRTVVATARVQGGVEYTVSVATRMNSKDLSDAESGFGVGASSDDSNGGGNGGNIPTHAPKYGMGPLALVWALILQLLVEPLGPISVWLPVAIVGAFLRSNYWYLIPIAYSVATIVGTIFAMTTLRIILEVFRARKIWLSGAESCFSVNAIIIHVYVNISHCRLGVFRGTPFALWIYRGLGLSVGQGTIMLGTQPQETLLISVGKDCVIEAGARLDGHYLEHLQFVYNPLEVGDMCWVQECARVMPGTTMKAMARVLPGSMVLPGDTLEKDMIWGGLPAEPIGLRPHARDADDHRQLKRRGRIGGRGSRNSSRKSSSRAGMGGFLGNIASIKQVVTMKKVATMASAPLPPLKSVSSTTMSGSSAV